MASQRNSPHYNATPKGHMVALIPTSKHSPRLQTSTSDCVAVFEDDVVTTQYHDKHVMKTIQQFRSSTFDMCYMGCNDIPIARTVIRKHSHLLPMSCIGTHAVLYKRSSIPKIVLFLKHNLAHWSETSHLKLRGPSINARNFLSLCSMSLCCLIKIVRLSPPTIHGAEGNKYCTILEKRLHVQLSFAFSLLTLRNMIFTMIYVSLVIAMLQSEAFKTKKRVSKNEADSYP